MDISSCGMLPDPGIQMDYKKGEESWGFSRNGNASHALHAAWKPGQVTG